MSCYMKSNQKFRKHGRLLSAIFQIIQSIRMGMWSRRSLRTLVPHPCLIPSISLVSPTPSRDPETDAKASDPADLWERSFTQPPPPPAPPQRLQCCSVWYWQLFYGQSKTTPAGQHGSHYSLGTFMCVSVWVCVWKCESVTVNMSACNQWFLLTMCHICLCKYLCYCEKNLFSNKCRAFRKRLVLLLWTQCLSGHTHTLYCWDLVLVDEESLG